MQLGLGHLYNLQLACSLYSLKSSEFFNLLELMLQYRQHAWMLKVVNSGFKSHCVLTALAIFLFFKKLTLYFLRAPPWIRKDINWFTQRNIGVLKFQRCVNSVAFKIPKCILEFPPWHQSENGFSKCLGPFISSICL